VTTPAIRAAALPDLKRRLRARLAGTAPGLAPARLAGLSPADSERFRHLLPADPVPAAVLVPIIDHPDGLTVLLTERATELRHHAGQIAFPGGRLEPGDADLVAAAIRETREEIGLAARHFEVLGFLPDHLIVTVYRVTPVVGLVAPGVPLTLDPLEVAGTFEVPLAYLLDPAHHRAAQRPIGGTMIEVFEIPFGTRNIWGATAGMLMTLYWLLTATDD
jgi:8-oxo-dGTP pyrophosphatase MutT (NUDIX family)